MNRIFLLMIALVLIASFPFLSNWYSREGALEPGKAQIESAIDAYIANNPKKILDSVMQYQIKQIEDQEKNQKLDTEDAIAKNQPSLLDFRYPSIKNGEDFVTIVEFFDVACGYCKLAKDQITEFVSRRDDVNYIFRNLPILGQASFIAAKYDYGFFDFLNLKGYSDKSDKYKAFYDMLLSHKGEYTENAILKMISSIGIDVELFKSYMKQNDEKISEMIDNTRDLARKLHISSVPTVIVGKKLLTKGIDQNSLDELVKEVSK